MITSGARKTRQTWTAVTTAQQISQANGPATEKNHTMATNTGAPITIVNSSAFSWSTTNVRGVVRLNPKRCSMTKVR